MIRDPAIDADHDQLCPAPDCDYLLTEDYMCPGYEDCFHHCQCDLIAKVRADERERQAQRLEGIETTHVAVDIAAEIVRRST